jgi:hypothetical protein
MIPTRLLLGILCVLNASCASTARDFRAEIGGRVLEFDCEVQKLHLDAAPEVRDLPAGAGPATKALGLGPGAETVAWLYHFEDDGSSLKDEECAYTVAVVLKERRPGRYDFPSDRAAVVFFCDNWGRGFRAAEARAVGGWLEVREADDRGAAGSFEVSLSGHAERSDRSREALSVRLRGRFRASR